MPFCPNCGEEVGSAKFCPNCGDAQGPGGHTKRFTSARKEAYNPYIGACLCVGLSPIAMMVYYFITEPQEDSLQKTFMYTIIPIALFIGINIIFTLITLLLPIGILPIPTMFLWLLAAFAGTLVLTGVIFYYLYYQEQKFF
jgi:uncharacterized membrane protein YvbJ